MKECKLQCKERKRHLRNLYAKRARAFNGIVDEGIASKTDIQFVINFEESRLKADDCNVCNAR